MSDPFEILIGELDRWQGDGKRASFWLRNDDGTLPSPRLRHLLALTADHRIPLALACIPGFTGGSLAKWVAEYRHAIVWQHGVWHRNHAPSTAKKQELISANALCQTDLAAGFAKLKVLFGDQFSPVLVPPWNRIDQQTADRLDNAGYEGVSMFGTARKVRFPAGIRIENTHTDLIDWSNGAKFIGEERALKQLVLLLQQQRNGHLPSQTLLGLLIHHAVMERDSWDFLSRLFEVTNGHPSARWCVPFAE